MKIKKLIAVLESTLQDNPEADIRILTIEPEPAENLYVSFDDNGDALIYEVKE